MFANKQFFYKCVFNSKKAMQKSLIPFFLQQKTVNNIMWWLHKIHFLGQIQYALILLEVMNVHVNLDLQIGIQIKAVQITMNVDTVSNISQQNIQLEIMK